ncbi:unnamed protein product, partial [Rotaria magnacalcarata]
MRFFQTRFASILLQQFPYAMHVSKAKINSFPLFWKRCEMIYRKFDSRMVLRHEHRDANRL